MVFRRLISSLAIGLSLSIVSAAIAQAQSDPTYTTSIIDSASSVNPGSAIADLNGDAKLDLVMANADNSIRILFANAVGGYQAPVKITTSGSPADVTVGDLNGDGKPDLVVMNNFSNQLQVFLHGVADGTFLPAQNVNVGLYAGSQGGPVNVELSDINGDSKLDVVVTNSIFSRLIWLTNTSGTNGMLSFSGALSYPSDGITGVRLIDIDGDSRKDAVAWSMYRGTVQVFKNYGSSFSPISLMYTGANPNSLDVGDFDGDGDNDIAYVTNYPENSLWFQPNIGGTFAIGNRIKKATLTNIPRAMKATDLNCDGKLDFAVTTGYKNPSSNFESFLNETSSAAALTLRTVPVRPLLGNASFDFETASTSASKPRNGNLFVFPLLDYNGPGTVDHLGVWNNTTPACQSVTGPVTPVYCSASAMYASWERIGNISVAGSSNPSTGTAGYENFSAVTFSARRGVSTTLGLTPQFPYYQYSENWIVFADLNQNGTFTDEGETLYRTPSATAASISTAFTIPVTAKTGKTKMRAIISYLSNELSPCGTRYYGQVEDYTLDILP